MTWTPETNRIQWVLLTEEEKAALEVCEHGLVYWTGTRWADKTDDALWPTSTYRAKHAPKRIVMWLHWCEEEGFELTRNKEAAITWRSDIGGWVNRIEMDEDGSDPTIEVEEV